MGSTRAKQVRNLHFSSLNEEDEPGDGEEIRVEAEVEQGDGHLRVDEGEKLEEDTETLCPSPPTRQPTTHDDVVVATEEVQEVVLDEVAQAGVSSG